MTASLTRRGALRLVLGSGLAVAGGMAEAGRDTARVHRRAALAFGTTVSVTLEATGLATAEAAFSEAFAAVRRIDRLASLTRVDGQVHRLNRDGVLDNPDPAVVAMLRMAQRMHAATQGAFDVTVQPMWLAFDAAARRGSWPDETEIAAIRPLVDGTAIRVEDGRIAFERPGMAITLNSLARGLAADHVAMALARCGIVNALFDIDVLGGLGRRPDGEPWRVAVRHPRDPAASVGVADVRGCLSTSGDYEYHWSADYARNHIIDPRRGCSPGDFASVVVQAESGLIADALSTAAFLVGRRDAGPLLERFGAEALFVDKAGAVSWTAGFPRRAPAA